MSELGSTCHSELFTGKFFHCDCGKECIYVEKEVDILDKEKNFKHIEVNFSIYHMGTMDHRPTFRDKLRHCWQILKTGKNYPDYIILSVSRAYRLGKYLLKITEEYEKAHT